MFRLRSFRACSRRLFHSGAVSRDQVLDQLQTCAAEDQVFDVVGRNKAKLTVNHVSYAIKRLWKFQKERPQMLRTVKQVRNHPQFLTLQVLAENKISLMDDASVVNLLYFVLRLQVEHHDSLVQQLVIEAWNRLDRLEITALLLAEELNPHQALGVVETMAEVHCRNLQLINKMSAVLLKNLETYRPVEIARITQSLILLHCQNPEIFSRLKAKLQHFLLHSVYPYEVTMLTRVLSMLPSRRPDEAVLSRVNSVIPQCNLNDLNTFAMVVAKWIRNDPSYRHNTSSKYVHLLQTLNRCSRERLHSFESLDVVLEEVKCLSGEWFDEMLLEESMVVTHKLIDQISWTNVNELGNYLNRTNYFCAPLMDRIANVTIDNIDKIHYSAMYPTLLPFAVLNYDPPKAEEFFDACIRHFTPYISSFDPHLLVLLAYALALAGYFPEEVVREIFNVDFLAKLDAHLEIFPDTLNMRIRLRLMELNRAVCLECPEFQVPWFHDRYCKQLQKRAMSSISPAQQQIHKMLGDVLGGMNCAKVGVLTPYFYTVDFEFVLDRHLHPVPYSEPSQLQITESGNVQWQSGSADGDRTELPPGARRIALDFLDSKSFCKNSWHMKGDAMMKKRHLEILGYHVLQIPHFEWNSMELSTEDAWKEYLRKKIFSELP
ncbi:FAST kinase domain-containing protein 1, mitochondrial [Garra rufa]|uniref:FAST kinase domain-containing protein 1, mitochondrial n=1 Tax=Garra rufa TaxID=137080 RepID=UPI003CCE6D7D